MSIGRSLLLVRSQIDVPPHGSLATQNSLTSDAPGLSNPSLLTTSGEDHDLALALALSEEDPAAFLAMQSEFNDFYGLVPPPQTVLVRAYSDDGDDRMLAEIQPRFIVMFEPNQDFVRRIEVCLLFVACPFGVRRSDCRRFDDRSIEARTRDWLLEYISCSIKRAAKSISIWLG